MLYYETILIVNQNLSEEEIGDLSQKVKKGMEDLGATILRMENWGKRRLTYEVKKSKKGYYLIYDLQTEARDFFNKIDVMLRYNENILKYMTVRIKKKDYIQNVGSEGIAPSTIMEEEPQELQLIGEDEE